MLVPRVGGVGCFLHHRGCVGRELCMSNHRPLRVTALVAPIHRRSFALVLGAAAVALSLGASVALQWIESPSAPATAKVGDDVVPPQMAPAVASATIEQDSSQDRVAAPKSEPTIAQAEPRAAAKSAPDFDVVPPAMAPAAAEAPKPVDPASATVATLAGAAAGGAAGAAPAPRRAPRGPKEPIPPP